VTLRPLQTWRRQKRRQKDLVSTWQPLLDELEALRQWTKDRPGDGSDYVFTSQKGGRMLADSYVFSSPTPEIL
jgi:hypothetical protein